MPTDDRRWSRGRGLAGKIDRLSRRLDDYAEKVSPVPALREQIRELAESQWGEPVTVLHLKDVRPAFDVPGRRKDGTLKGKRLVRRFFWNIVRFTLGGLVNVVLLVVAGGAGNVFARSGVVRGPSNAQALGLVDAAVRAKDPWLVHSSSHVAVIDSGDPPEIRWHAAKPGISLRRNRLTWPDGSVFQYSGVDD